MIEVADVDVSIEGTPILQDISVTVDSGEVVGLIGPNGAGKSTLLRAIDGVLEADAGWIHIAGDAIESLSARERARRVAVLSQATEVHFDFSVRDIVAMGRTPYASRFGNGDDRATDIVDSALERTETMHLADRSITAVSGGERQRVLVARAIAQETPVLLLDEPTASLDINHRIATFELVRDLANDGKAILAAIHDLDLAARYCDRLLLIANGQQLACGEPSQVLATGQLERAYGTRTAVRHDELTDSPSVTPLSEKPTDPGITVHVIGHGDACGSICRTLDAAGYAVSVGIVETGSPGHEIAAALELPVLTRSPGGPIDPATATAHSQFMDRAAVTIVSPFHVGRDDLGLLDAAASADRALFIDDPPFCDRNHVGEAGRQPWDAIERRHDPVAPDQLLATLAERLTNPESRGLAHSD